MIYTEDNSPIFDNTDFWMGVLKRGRSDRLSRHGHLCIRYAEGMMTVRYKSMGHNGHSVVRLGYHVQGLFKFTLYMSRTPLIPDIQSGNIYEVRLWGGKPAMGSMFKLKKVYVDKYIEYIGKTTSEDVEHHMTIFQLTRDDINESV